MPLSSLAGFHGILFDKDGTLIDFQKSWEAPLREIARLAAKGEARLARRLLIRGGMNPDTGIIAADTLFASGHTREIAEAFILEGADFAPSQLARDLDAIFVTVADHAVPVTDLPVLFKTLRGLGFEIGVASSDSEEAVWRLLRRFSADGFVSFVAGYNSGHGAKPTRGMFDAFCAARGLSPREVAMVGDNPHDMRMGRAGGAGACIGVLTGTGSRHMLAPECDLILASIAGLPTLAKN